MENNWPSIIAIDGPAAAGKTTLARELAQALGYLYFDTGLMYRAATIAALMRKLDVNDEASVTALAGDLDIDVLPAPEDEELGVRVLVNGEDVTEGLRASSVDARVSQVSSYPGVRTLMTAQQRRIGRRGRVVMVGRDIGTVVLPEADLKLFMDASPEARAQRRWEELAAQGRDDSYDEIFQATLRRDATDSQRAVAPLRPAEDAIHLDTTDLGPDAVLDYVLSIVHSWKKEAAS